MNISSIRTGAAALRADNLLNRHQELKRLPRMAGEPLFLHRVELRKISLVSFPASWLPDAALASSEPPSLSEYPRPSLWPYPSGEKTLDRGRKKPACR